MGKLKDNLLLIQRISDLEKRENSLIQRISDLEKVNSSFSQRILDLENNKSDKLLERDYQKHLSKLFNGASHLKNKYGIIEKDIIYLVSEIFEGVEFKERSSISNKSLYNIFQNIRFCSNFSIFP